MTPSPRVTVGEVVPLMTASLMLALMSLSFAGTASFALECCAPFAGPGAFFLFAARVRRPRREGRA